MNRKCMLFVATILTILTIATGALAVCQTGSGSVCVEPGRSPVPTCPMTAMPQPGNYGYSEVSATKTTGSCVRVTASGTAVTPIAQTVPAKQATQAQSAACPAGIVNCPYGTRGCPYARSSCMIIGAASGSCVPVTSGGCSIAFLPSCPIAVLGR